MSGFGFFCFVFSCIRTEYGDILRISPFTIRILENADRNTDSFYAGIFCSMLMWGSWFSFYFLTGNFLFFSMLNLEQLMHYSRDDLPFAVYLVDSENIRRITKSRGQCNVSSYASKHSTLILHWYMVELTFWSRSTWYQRSIDTILSALIQRESQRWNNVEFCWH